jgi:hypothetical protein
MPRQTSLSDPAARALGHVRARTRTGRFANQLWDMSDQEWEAALDELRRAGYQLYWTYGTVADDPTITGGWRLSTPCPSSPPLPPPQPGGGVDL